MIDIHQTWDADTSTLTLRLIDLGPEHEFEGRLCHAMTHELYELGAHRLLSLLGYEYAGGQCLRATGETRHYFARPLPE